jgi:20S proteasome subunit beta 3
MATDRTKVFKMHDKLYIGLSGLATDQSTFQEKIKFRLAMYKLREVMFHVLRIQIRWTPFG